MKHSSQTIAGLFSRATPTYESVGPRHFSYFAEKLVDFVRVDFGSDVLDVATGTGAVLLQVAKQQGSRAGRIVGIDITSAMLSRAAAEIERRALRNVELCQMDGERLAFPEASFDAVLCSFGLQAFSDQRAALAGFYRVLRPAGRVGIVFPLGWHFDSDARWNWEADVLRSFGALETTEDEFDPADLVPAMRDAGFVEIETADMTCPLDFRDEEEWWAWSWSHGTRSLFEAVSGHQRRALRQALFDGLQSCKGDDDLFHGSMSAVVAHGSKPIGARFP